MREASYDLIQKSPSTSSWINTEMARSASGVVKIGPSGFPESGHYFCGRKLVQQTIQDTAVTKFRRLRLSSIGASSGALLLDRSTNAWTVGPSVDDVSSLSTFGGVVRSMDSTANALPPRIVRTC
jgi:hypothetical protein